MSRNQYTNYLKEAVLEGEIDPQRLIFKLLAFMTEDDVKQFCIEEGYNQEEI